MNKPKSYQVVFGIKKRSAVGRETTFVTGASAFEAQNNNLAIEQAKRIKLEKNFDDILYVSSVDEKKVIMGQLV